MAKGITLIGMSEAGKSTTGPLIAQQLGWPLHDIDDIIISKEQKLIGEIIQNKGNEYLLGLEVSSVLELELEGAVLVTPGSIVYGTDCHDYLRQHTDIVWLDVTLDELLKRLGTNPDKAGALVVGKEQSFEKLFNERRPLYQSLADIVINCDKKDPETIAQEILGKVSKKGG